jgi:hypothetical protein
VLGVDDDGVPEVPAAPAELLVVVDPPFAAGLPLQAAPRMATRATLARRAVRRPVWRPVAKVEGAGEGAGKVVGSGMGSSRHKG